MFLLIIWIQEVKIDLLSLAILIHVFLWTNRLPYYGSSTWKRPRIPTFTKKKKKKRPFQRIIEAIVLACCMLMSFIVLILLWLFGKIGALGCHILTYLASNLEKKNTDNVILKYASTKTAIIYYQKGIHFVLNYFWGC